MGLLNQSVIAMSFYQKLAEIAPKYIGIGNTFKYGFNFSPMYRRSTGRVISVSNDLMVVNIRIPITYKNKNYVGSIFGGSMFSATDPIPMVQLINLLGKDYVVWDKSAEIFFKKPAREDLYATFTYTTNELDDIKQRVSENNEIEIVKSIQLMNKNGDQVFCEVKKVLYVADKSFYKQKRKQRSLEN